MLPSTLHSTTSPVLMLTSCGSHVVPDALIVAAAGPAGEVGDGLPSFLPPSLLQAAPASRPKTARPKKILRIRPSFQSGVGRPKPDWYLIGYHCWRWTQPRSSPPPVAAPTWAYAAWRVGLVLRTPRCTPTKPAQRRRVSTHSPMSQTRPASPSRSRSSRVVA